MVITLAFQAKDVGSIPIIRSIKIYIYKNKYKYIQNFILIKKNIIKINKILYFYFNYIFFYELDYKFY